MKIRKFLEEYRGIPIATPAEWVAFLIGTGAGALVVYLIAIATK